MPLKAQIAETHIKTRKFLQQTLEYNICYPNNVWEFHERTSDHISAPICVSANCAINGTSETKV